MLHMSSYRAMEGFFCAFLKIVTSTTVYVGEEGNILEERPENCKILKVENPILTETDLLKIKYMRKPGFKVEEVPITYYKNTSLERAIDRLFLEVDRAHKDGANIIILSDRDIDENHVPIPSLLAVSALQQYLVRTKKRTGVALILESGEPREVHHFAALLGYGACAVNPYLAHESIRSLIASGMLDKDYYAAVCDYDLAVLHGIVKIASKMGISTIQSYQGAQIFEAIGISKDVVDKYFTDTVSRVGGITLKDIAGDVDALHSAAFDPLGLDVDLTLESVGSHKSRSGEEAHLYNPLTIHLLQEAARTAKTTPSALTSKIQSLLEEIKTLHSENEKLKSKLANDSLGDVMSQVKEVNGLKVLAARVAGVDMNGMRNLGDQLKDKLGEGVIVLACEQDGKVNLMATATDAVQKKGAHAGNLIKAIAGLVGGGGGGRPGMAQAGGKNPAGMDDALKKAVEVVEEQTK